MNTNKKVGPNLYEFATSELSQDAFLCWLLSWADPQYAEADKALHTAGLNFVRALIKKHDESISEAELESIEVKPQYARIDILVNIRYGGELYTIVIEDKVGASIHGNQLAKYKQVVKENYPDPTHIFIYLQTGAIAERPAAEKEGYRVFSRRELLDVLSIEKDKIENDIYRDYYEYLRERDFAFEAFRRDEIDQWGPKAWEGFFSALQELMYKRGEELEWSYEGQSKVKGEYVAYWKCIKKEKEDRHPVFLQIHKKCDEEDNGRYFLAFRVGDVSKDESEEVRDNMQERLMRAVENHEWSGKVDRPKNPRPGNTMNFCETTDQDCWLAKGGQGKIDLEKTVENLKKAEALLASAVADIPQKPMK